MRAQGLSMHSHSGNQVISRTMTIRIHVCTGKTVELDMFPHHTLQHLRLVRFSSALAGGSACLSISDLSLKTGVIKVCMCYADGGLRAHTYALNEWTSECGPFHGKW